MVCYNCRQIGHFAPNCPLLKKGGGASGKGQGHRQRQKALIQGALIEGGCSAPSAVSCPPTFASPGPPRYGPLPPHLVQMTSELSGLGAEDFLKVVAHVIGRNQEKFPSKDLKALSNKVRDFAKKADKRGIKRRAEEEGLEGQGTASLSANHVGLIIRGDFIAAEEIFFMHVEKFRRVKGAGEEEKGVNGEVNIVTGDGNLAFHAFIIRDPDDLKGYHAIRVTGMAEISEPKVAIGLTEGMARCHMNRLFANKEIWSHGGDGDLERLGFYPKGAEGSYPDPIPSFVGRTTRNFFRDEDSQPFSLGELGLHFLGRNSLAEGHTSLRAARLMITLVKKMRILQRPENLLLGNPFRFACPVFLQQRRRPRNPSGQPEPRMMECNCSLGVEEGGED